MSELTRAERKRALTALNVRDLLAAYKMDRWPCPGLWRALARPAGAAFAEDILAFEAAMERGGLRASGEWTMARYAGTLQVMGAERVPRDGPLLVAANHPGMVDAMALWSAVDRADLKVLAAERDLLDLLPHTLRHLIIIRPGEMSALREVVRHLQAGGAVLTFPAGQIEPDPAIAAGALESLSCWSESLSAMVRRVPAAKVLPAVVRGVLSPQAMRSPLLRRFRDPKDHDWAAATLQVIVPAYRRVDVRVDFGEPIRVEEGPCLMGELRHRMRRLLLGVPG